MKPIPPMSKAERDARKAAIVARAQRKAQEDNGPPKNRMSISGAAHLGSPDNEWIFAAGQGWYHMSEDPWFNDRYRRCVESAVYYAKDHMCRTADGDWLNKKELGRTWVIDAYGGKARRKEGLVEVYDGRGILGYTTPEVAANPANYLRCDIDKRLYPKGQVVRFKHPLNPERKNICVISIRKMPEAYQECPHCSQYAEVAGLINRPGMGNVTACNDCWEIFRVKNIIHVHNYDGYPDAISKHPTVKLLVGGKLKDVPGEQVGLAERLYGVECEVEIQDNSKLNRYQLATNVMDALGKDFVVMKNDGSLKNHPRDSDLWGFEIVTAPADFGTHKERWAKLESMEGFKWLRAWDTITCGMHVHVSKAALTTLQVGRIQVFINNPKNKKFIEKVAGRNSEAASRFLGDKTFGDGLRPDPDKYCAVNIRPKHTIEFRIFRGTIRHRHIIRNMEFVDAVCSYCFPAARSLQDIKNWKAFVDYCRMNRRRWPLFVEWLEAKEYIPARKLKPGDKPEECVEKDTVTEENASKWY